MDNNYHNFKDDIDRINLRIKEYLWNKSNLFQTREVKFSNDGSQFLAK